MRQHPHHAALDVIADPRRSEPLAFEREKRHLVVRINGAETRIEFEAVDDPDRMAEPDVLRPQIAVPVDDVPPTHAGGQNPCVRLEETELDRVKPTNETVRHSQPRIQENSLVVCEASAPLMQVSSRRQVNRGCPLIELGERHNQTIKVPRLDAMLDDERFEHLLHVESAHDDEPIDDRAPAPDGQALFCRDQRHYIEVDVRRQTAVQAKLGATGSLSLRQGGEVEIGKAHRLLELVDAVADHEDPRHVGLVASDFWSPCCIGFPTA